MVCCRLDMEYLNGKDVCVFLGMMPLIRQFILKLSMSESGQRSRVEQMEEGLKERKLVQRRTQKLP